MSLEDLRIELEWSLENPWGELRVSSEDLGELRAPWGEPKVIEFETFQILNL